MNEKPKTKTKVTSRTLQCTLPPDVMHKMASDAADLDEQIRLKIEARKETYKRINGEIADMKTELSEMLQAIRDGEEFRDVACTITLDFEADERIVTRNDTGEEIEDRRPLTADEAQEEFAELAKFFDEPFLEFVERTLTMAPTISLDTLKRRFDLDTDAAEALMDISESRAWVGPPKEDGQSRDVLIFDPPSDPSDHEPVDVVPPSSDADGPEPAAEPPGDSSNPEQGQEPQGAGGGNEDAEAGEPAPPPTE